MMLSERPILSRSYDVKPSALEVLNPPLLPSVHNYPSSAFHDHVSVSKPPDSAPRRIASTVLHFAQEALGGVIIPRRRHRLNLQNSLTHNPASKEYYHQNPLDPKLAQEFPSLLKDVRFENIALPIGSKPIAHPEKFQLLPIIGSLTQRTTLERAGYDVSMPLDIRHTYGITSIYKGRPFLDTRQAIGLSYGNWLVALAAAGIDQHGNLAVCQIQDVSGVKKKDDRELFYRTGLHNGFQWRDTLVRGWEEIGGNLGAATISIQSHANSRWPQVVQTGKAGYDGVAERLGYEQHPKSGDWFKNLT